MINLSKARELCTEAELRFVESCRGRELARDTEAQLKEKMALARELRDKWADAFTRQRRQGKQEQGFPANKGNVRSREKSELFAEVLARVEAQLKKVTAPAKPKESRAALRRAAKEAAKKPDIPDQHPSRQEWADSGTTRDRVRFGQQGANPSATRDRMKTAGVDTRIRAHVAAQGRRSQARRDSRVKK